MKTYITILLSAFFMIGCDIYGTCGCDIPVPETKLFIGKWRLDKITYGFPPPNSPNFTTLVEDEIYEFSENKYKLFRNGKEVESGNYTLEDALSNGIIEKQLKFQSSNTYSTYTILANPLELKLYQRTPIGVKLADGNTFHYKFIQ